MVVVTVVCVVSDVVAWSDSLVACVGEDCCVVVWTVVVVSVRVVVVCDVLVVVMLVLDETEFFSFLLLSSEQPINSVKTIIIIRTGAVKNDNIDVLLLILCDAE